jgi:hypothetical protein
VEVIKLAAIAEIRATIEFEGLRKTINFPMEWTTTTTPTKYVQMRQNQAVADTAEALDMGDVTTPLLIALVCVTNDVDLDCNYATSFSADITVNEGEGTIFMPKGTVWIKNNDSAEQSTVEYIVIGT